jgi:hypothetical protein
VASSRETPFVRAHQFIPRHTPAFLLVQAAIEGADGNSLVPAVEKVFIKDTRFLCRWPSREAVGRSATRRAGTRWFAIRVIAAYNQSFYFIRTTTLTSARRSILGYLLARNVGKIAYHREPLPQEPKLLGVAAQPIAYQVAYRFADHVHAPTLKPMPS